jgi:hypothetical protein
MITFIVLGTLAALMLSLWMVYSYINNILTTEIHRSMLYDSVYESRLRKLQERAGGDWASAGTGWGDDPDQLEAERQEKLAQLKRFEDLQAAGESLSETEKAERASQAPAIPRIRAELAGRLSEEKIAEMRDAPKRLELARQEEEKRMRQAAAHEAEILVPRSLTVAGMGITGSFFIELTAILTIIFGIIILGLVGVLGTTEIAPILAAIAGYVLGKTTSGWAPYGGAAGLQQPLPPQSPPSLGGGSEGEAAPRSSIR